MQHAARELPLPQWITHLRGLDFSFFCDCHGSHLLHFPQPTKSPCLTGITLAFLCLSGFEVFLVSSSGLSKPVLATWEFPDFQLG